METSLPMDMLGRSVGEPIAFFDKDAEEENSSTKADSVV